MGSLFKRIWRDPVWSSVIAAAIIAGGTVAVGKFRSSRSDVARNATGNAGTPDTAVATAIRIGDVHTVGEGSAFVDPQTGFSFTVEEISSRGDWFWGLVPSPHGVLSSYRLPDGTRGSLYRYPAGHRVPFDFSTRKFFFVISDLDYQGKRASVRVDEVIPTNP